MTKPRKHELESKADGEDNEDPISLIGHARKARRGKSFRRFTVDLSTEKHFGINFDETPVFVGAFGSVRKQFLDHDKYHSHYRKERQWLHDSIVEDYIENNSSEHSELDTIWFVLTVGIQGAGKCHTMRALREQGHFPLSYCCIDSDEIRRLLPEFEYFVEHAELILDTLTSKEAGYIAETLCWAALQAGQSVLWDGCLRNPQWFHQHILRLRENFPNLRVAVIHIVPPSSDVIHSRREKKEETTGRHLYPDELEYFESELGRIADAVEVVRGEADFVATICNGTNGLEILDKKWEDFSKTFGEPIKSISQVPMVRSEHGLDEVFPEMPRFSRRSLLAASKDRSGLRTSRRSFHVLKSTEENHCSSSSELYGRFKNIRATLDYSYHKNYTFERQRFQDSILQDFLQQVSITDKDGYVCTTPTEPWIVFTAGPMGAGKSYTMNRLVDKGRFPLVAFVNVDPDELRRKLPEYHLYANLAPELAGELTRKEAGFLAEILTLAALQAGKNVLLDGSLRDAEWYQHYFSRLRTEFPILRLAIIQVTAPKETVLARAAARAEETGRVVPESLLLEAYEQVPRSVEILGPLVDYHVTLHNPQDKPDIQLSTKGETWQSFQEKWIQTCAWVPRKSNGKSSLVAKKNDTSDKSGQFVMGASRVVATAEA